MKKLIRLIVSGEVQGVGYRNSIFQFISQHYIPVGGYVRNLPNGTVEIVLQGEVGDIKRIEEFSYCGSPRCSVEHVDRIEMVCGDEDYSDFHIEY